MNEVGCNLCSRSSDYSSATLRFKHLCIIGVMAKRKGGLTLAHFGMCLLTCMAISTSASWSGEGLFQSSLSLHPLLFTGRPYPCLDGGKATSLGLEDSEYIIPGSSLIDGEDVTKIIACLQG